MPYNCTDCPRNCGALRSGPSGRGYCGSGELIGVARVMRHMWEEPCLGGQKGVENIFLTGCNLKCIYCQNHKINGSEDISGIPGLLFASPEDFGKILIDAANTDAQAVGIVTGDHYIRQIAASVTPDVKAAIKKPLIFNCGGYMKPETVELLRGKVDIFMPDFKYSDGYAAGCLSKAADYPEVAKAAILKCFELAGPAVFDDDGLMKSGVIVRHLVLPGRIQNTLGVIDELNGMFKPGDIVFSLMSQYLPLPGLVPPPCFERLTGPVSKAEYKKSKEYFENALNLTLGYTQDLSSSDPSYVPNF